MRIVFMGTPEFSVTALEALKEAGHDIVAVYTQPPKPAGRGLALTPSPVHKKAEEWGIPVHTPRTLKNAEVQETLARYAPEVIVVVAYGLLLPVAVLQLPPHGCFNIHASLLPRWRGAAPLQRAIMAGDTVSGVTIMYMSEGLDEGDMVKWETLPLTEKTTTQELHDALCVQGARLMCEVLEEVTAGTISATPQPEEGVTYAAKIQKAEAKITWSQDAATVIRHIHGLSPFPGAWFMAGEERIKVLLAEEIPLTEASPAGTVVDSHLTIACAGGAVRLLRLQRAGKKAMDAHEAMRGWTLEVGQNVGE